MLNNGPKQNPVTPEEVKKFLAILKLPAGDEKTRLIQALSPTEKEHFKIYTDVLKQKQKIKQVEKEVAELRAREDELLREDKTILTQAANKYAEKLDTFTREKPAANTSATTGAPKLNQKK